MKSRIVISLLLALCWLAVEAYSNPDTIDGHHQSSVRYAYLSYGVGPVAKGSIVPVSVNLVFPSYWGVSATYQAVRTKASALPADYVGGLCIYDCNPRDKFDAFSVRVIREFPTNSKQFRFGLEAGPEIGSYREAAFRRNNSPGWFGSNYSVTYKQQTIAGAVLRAKVAYLFSRYVGMEAGLTTGISRFPYFGADLRLMIGEVRRRLKPVH